MIGNIENTFEKVEVLQATLDALSAAMTKLTQEEMLDTKACVHVLTEAHNLRGEVETVENTVLKLMLRHIADVENMWDQVQDEIKRRGL